MQGLIHTHLVSAESSAALKDEHHLPIRLSAEFIDRRLNHGFGHVTHRNLHKVGNCLQRRTADLADALLISVRGPTASTDGSRRCTAAPGAIPQASIIARTAPTCA